MLKKWQVALIFLVCAVGISNAQWSWGPTIAITNDDANQQTSLNNAKCVLENGTSASFVWQDNRYYVNSRNKVWYRPSPTGDYHIISHIPIENHFGSPSIARLNGIERVVYSSALSEIFYCWGPDSLHTEYIDGSSEGPSLATGTNNTLHVVYHRHDYGPGYSSYIYYRYKVGESDWSNRFRICNSGNNQEYASIASSNGYVYVVWAMQYEPEYYRIFFRRSTNNGQTWSKESVISMPDQISCKEPCISASGSNISVVWRNSSDGSYIYHRKSTNNGASWMTTADVVAYETNNRNPSVSLYNNDVHVVWSANDVDYWYIKYRAFMYGSWQSIQTVRLSTVGLMKPSVSANATNAHIVWEEGGSESAPLGDIMYRRTYFELLASGGKEPSIMVQQLGNNLMFEGLSTINHELKINIFDASGRLVESRNLKKTGTSARFEINSDQLQNGIYFVSFEDAGKKITEKMVVIR